MNRKNLILGGIFIFSLTAFYYSFGYQFIGCLKFDSYCNYNYILHGEYPLFDRKFDEKLIEQNKYIEDYLYKNVKDLDYENEKGESISRYYDVLRLLNEKKFKELIVNNFRSTLIGGKAYVNLRYSYLYLENNDIKNILKYKDSEDKFIRLSFISGICKLSKNNIDIKNILSTMKTKESYGDNIELIDICLKE